MIQKQTNSEARGRSLAEKARICAPCEDVSDEMLNEDTAAKDAVSGEDAAEESKEEATEEAPDPLAELYGEQEIRLDLQVDKWDLYAFLMHHTYFGFSGVVGILLSVFCLGQGSSDIVRGEAGTTTAVFMFIGLWFILISPIVMIGKASMQMRSVPSLQKPISYVFTENGLIQEQGELKTGCRWNQITKAVLMKRIWILYVGKLRGSILPVRQLGECRDDLKALIQQKTGRKR